MPDSPLLLLVPNVSTASPDGLAGAFAPARLLDTHSDLDHQRTVLTLSASQRDAADALAAGARAAGERIDLRRNAGVHPYVGALDVAPVVFLHEADRGAATAAALTAAALIGALGIPVFLYGELATSDATRERAAIRRGGPAELTRRLAAGELKPDYGPAKLHPTAGATLVTARPPLIAFNVELADADLETARAIAAELREDGGGLSGVRALGLWLESRGRAQVSLNVHDHRAAPLAEIVDRIRARAAVAETELVGLAPGAAFDGFPDDVPVRNRRTIEDALGRG